MLGRQEARFLLALAGAIAFFFASSAPSPAQVTLGKSLVFIKAKDRPIRNLLVLNESPDPVYVSVKTQLVIDPGSDPKESQETEDLLISPKAFSIGAKSERTVRLLLKAERGDKERLYRVYFIPRNSDFGEEHKIEAPGGRTASLRIMTGAGMLVFVEPKNPKSDLQWTRSASGIIFTNKGNVHMEIGRGLACPPLGKKEECQKLPGKRVYAESSFEVEVDPDKVVRYQAWEGGYLNTKPLEISPVYSSTQNGSPG